ncbi:MAG: hypothetical protein V4592_17830 [Bacteroidota bacterium]
MAKQNSGLDAKILGENICKLAGIISDAGLCNDTGPLNHAGNYCIKNAQDSTWNYKFNFLEFNIANQPGCIPEQTDELKLRFSIDIQGIIPEEGSDTILNPLEKLTFDLELLGQGFDEEKQDLVDLHASWHLDKHIRGEKDGAPKYSHPEYHLAFGGAKMEANPHIYGASLILPTPRLSYPPMDAVLGINFILQNYFHKKDIAGVLTNPDYRAIISYSQRLLLQPYISSLMTFWTGEKIKFGKFVDPYSLFPLLIE